MLTPLDDFPVHQTSQPLVVPSSGDLNHYDRFFFNGYTADGALYFGLALGLYPNRFVIDGAFSVVRDGVQVSVFASGRCPLDRATTVGPITVQIIEPMRVLRLSVDAPEQGLRADLTFRARTAPVEEPHFSRYAAGQIVFDYTRLTQFGAWEGWIELDGERVTCAPGEVLGSRDRSWGVRLLGERLPAAPPALLQFCWLWAPVSFADRCTHFDLNEEADGRRWHESAFHVPLGDGPPEPYRGVERRIAWEPGTRRIAEFGLDLTDDHGIVTTLEFEPLLHFQMSGLGYTHPRWRHGTWQGELAVGGDRWTLADVDPVAPTSLHIQTLCRVRAGDAVGTGILEQLVIGPHEPTGLTGFFDGAP